MSERVIQLRLPGKDFVRDRAGLPVTIVAFLPDTRELVVLDSDGHLRVAYVNHIWVELEPAK